MGGRVYTAAVLPTAVTAAVDLMTLSAPATGMFRILSVRVGQNTEEADAQAEMLSIAITRYATAGSGGAAVTENPHLVGTGATGVTATSMNSTQGATPTVVLEDAWNVQIGWLYQPAPEEMIWVPPSGVIAIESPDTPADSISIAVSVTYEEYD